MVQCQDKTWLGCLTSPPSNVPTLFWSCYSIHIVCTCHWKIHSIIMTQFIIVSNPFFDTGLRQDRHFISGNLVSVHVTHCSQTGFPLSKSVGWSLILDNYFNQIKWSEPTDVFSSCYMHTFPYGNSCISTVLQLAIPSKKRLTDEIRTKIHLRYYWIMGYINM